MSEASHHYASKLPESLSCLITPTQKLLRARATGAAGTRGRCWEPGTGKGTHSGLPPQVETLEARGSSVPARPTKATGDTMATRAATLNLPVMHFWGA